MRLPRSVNSKAPLLSQDIFRIWYYSEDASRYQQSAQRIRKIARDNMWGKVQTREAQQNILQYVIVITDHLQKISFAGKGFFEMTGYTFDEARGRNPRFLQGAATNKKNIRFLKEHQS